jgi:hypothetical protein
MTCKLVAHLAPDGKKLVSGGQDTTLLVWQVAGHDVIQVEVVPQPACQPHIPEAARIGPGHGVEPDADDIGVVRKGNVVLVREEPELPAFALAVVKDHGALPAAFLVVVEFAEVGDRMLAWASIGADALDEGVVGVRLTVFPSERAPRTLTIRVAHCPKCSGLGVRLQSTCLRALHLLRQLPLAPLCDAKEPFQECNLPALLPALLVDGEGGRQLLEQRASGHEALGPGFLGLHGNREESREHGEH